MAKKKVGLWLIGACGGVGTTAALGLAAIRNKLSDTTSLVTELPLFETLKLFIAQKMLNNLITRNFNTCLIPILLFLNICLNICLEQALQT